jgi:hypothetical protein
MDNVSRCQIATGSVPAHTFKARFATKRVSVDRCELDPFVVGRGASEAIGWVELYLMILLLPQLFVHVMINIVMTEDQCLLDVVIHSEWQGTCQP